MLGRGLGPRPILPLFFFDEGVFCVEVGVFGKPSNPLLLELLAEELFTDLIEEPLVAERLLVRPDVWS